jgi:hypothetical protein
MRLAGSSRDRLIKPPCNFLPAVPVPGRDAPGFPAAGGVVVFLAVMRNEALVTIWQATFPFGWPCRFAAFVAAELPAAVRHRVLASRACAEIGLDFGYQRQARSVERVTISAPALVAGCAQTVDRPRGAGVAAYTYGRCLFFWFSHAAHHPMSAASRTNPLRPKNHMTASMIPGCSVCSQLPCPGAEKVT